MYACLYFITGQPVISEHPQNMSALGMTHVSLTCSANGLPRPSISWFKQQKDGSFVLLLSVGRYSVSLMSSGVDNRTSQLTISSVVPSDAAKYLCKASTTTGAVVTSFSYLLVNGNLQRDCLLLGN